MLSVRNRPNFNELRMSMATANLNPWQKGEPKQMHRKRKKATIFKMY